MKSITEKLTSKKAQGYINKVGALFVSFPRLPKGLVEFFVKVVPYLVIISALINLFFGPVVTLVSLAFITTTGSSPLFLSTLILSILFFINGLIFILAFGPLKRRELNGWIFLFWAEVIMSLETLVRIAFGHTKVFSILGPALIFYILFEMKNFYKKK